MQIVNFQCGHCSKLMGVGSEYLGQQVRCPHCQQVVVAPPPASPNPTPAAVPPLSPFQPGTVETIAHTPAAAGDHEDIFSPPEASDDLFGRTEAPRIEIPPDSLAPTMAGESAVAQPQPALEPTVTTTLPYMPSEAASSGPVNGEGTAVLPSSGNEAPWMNPTVTEMISSAAPEAPASGHEEMLGGPSTSSATRPARRSESGTPWFMILVFSPLLLYAIVITVFAVMLYQQEREVEQKLRNRFDMMPDEGDNPGVQKGKKVTRVYRYDPKLATLPLPDKLITSLDKKGGEPIRVGELQIAPKSVQRKRINVFVEGSEKSEPCTGDSLVLNLTLKNLSSEYAFAPLDNYFDRYWKPGTDQLPPFTQLKAGDKEPFYGGPAHWYPRGDQKNRREWVEGRKAVEADLLQPGEERDFFVCTDGQDPKALLTLFGENKGEKVREPYHGAFLWRVRVRRGLVNVLGKEIPATAVVGVKFTDKDIH
jgi:hypothetical protein